MKNLIIVGAGGFGLEAAAYSEDITRIGTPLFSIKGFLDDVKTIGTHHAGYPILGSTDSPVDQASFYIIAVGLPAGRKHLAEKLAAKGANFISLIHPQSYIASSAQIDVGTIIAPFSFIGPAAQLGKHCLVNVHATLGHESHIGDYCVVSPYAATHGRVVLDNGVFMASHACATAKVKVGKNTKIAAGAVVYNDLPADTLAMGNPAAFKVGT